MLLKDLYIQKPEQKKLFKINGMENNRIGYYCNKCSIAIPIKNKEVYEKNTLITIKAIKSNNHFPSLFLDVNVSREHICGASVEEILLYE